MITQKRTPISENAAYAPENQTLRANRSATQWLFNPYSIADTTNWAVTTGVGKLAVGGLTKVTNVTEVTTPNRTAKNDQGAVAFDSTFDAVISGKAGYVENERFAMHIASEIENNFPRRVHRIRALEGIDDTKLVDLIVESLLGEEMAVAEIEGDEPVPVLTQMLEIVRFNLREIARSNSPQKALLLQTGKEFESTIADNIKLAGEDLRTPIQDVAANKRVGFDLNAKRNFLALGKPIPEVKIGAPATVQAEAKPVDDRVLSALERIADAFGVDTKIQGEPDDTTAHIVDEDETSPRVEANQAVAVTTGSEVEMEFQAFPKIVETKALTNKQVEAADKKEEKKAEKLAAEKEAESEESSEADLSTTPTKCAAIKADGERCNNDAVKGSKFCHIAAHKK